MISYLVAPGIPNKILKLATGSRIEFISTQIAHYFGLELKDLKSPCRKRELTEARQIAMHICYKRTGMTLKSIGDFFGGRDHSTVIYAKETVSDLLDTDKLFKSKYLMVERLIDGY